MPYIYNNLLMWETYMGQKKSKIAYGNLKRKDFTQKLGHFPIDTVVY